MTTTALILANAILDLAAVALLAFVMTRPARLARRSAARRAEGASEPSR